MNHHLLLVIHLLCATIWIGGHLFMVTCMLPGILKRKDTQALLNFEKKYEPLGMGALILLVLTGFWMAFQFGIDWQDLFSFANPIERVVSIKLLLLITTVAFALSAQIRVLPSLKKSAKRLPEMAVHAICVTLIGIIMLILGSFVRYGGI